MIVRTNTSNWIEFSFNLVSQAAIYQCSCPKWGDYLDVSVSKSKVPVEEIPIDARCLSCGYRLDLRLILLTRPSSEQKNYDFS